MPANSHRSLLRDYFAESRTDTWGLPAYAHSSIADPHWKSIRTLANTATSAFSVVGGNGRLRVAAHPGGTAPHDQPAQTEIAWNKTMAPGSGEVMCIKHSNAPGYLGGLIAGFGGVASNMAMWEFVHQHTSSTQGQIQLRRRTGTSFNNSSVTLVQGANVTFGTGTPAARVCMRLQVLGGRVKCKVWPHGTLEPTTWNIDVATTGGPASFGYSGLMMMNTRTTVATLDFDYYAIRAWNATTSSWYNFDPTSTTVQDDNTVLAMADPSGWGTSASGHEWMGDMGSGDWEASVGEAEVLQYRRIGSGGGPVINRYTTGTNYQANAVIGPNRVDSLQTARIMPNAIPSSGFRLIFRAGTYTSNGNYEPRTTSGEGIEVAVDPTANTLGVAHKGSFVHTKPLGYTVINNGTRVCTLKAQIRSGRLFAKCWDTSQSEPSEWLINYPLPTGLNATGTNGVTCVMGTAVGVSYTLYNYDSTAATERSFRYGDVTNALKSVMVATKIPAIRRRSTVSRAFTSTMSAVPQVGKKSSVTRQIKATTSPAPARTRYNYIGSGYVGGILTKFNHVPNLNGKVAATIQPRRRRKSTVTRSIKGTLTVVPKRRYFVNTPSHALKMTAVGRSKIIITRTVSRSIKMTLIGAPVGYKTGATTRAIKFTRPSVASRKRVKSTVTREIISRMRIRFGPTVEDEANSTIHLGTSQSPSFVKFAGKTTDRLVSGTYFHGFVPRRVEGSVETGFELSKYAQGFIKTPQSASNIARVSMRTFPVRAKPAKVNASVSVGMYMDTSDFAWMYEEVLEKRASMIHYACTSVAGQGIIITYRHEVPDTLQSRTYFLAKLDDDTVLLYGYSTNVWNTNTILVNIVEDSTHPEWENVKSALSIKV